MNEVQKSEIVKVSFQAVKDYVSQRRSNGKNASPSEGLVHAGLLCFALSEVESLFGMSELNDESFVKAMRFTVFAELENGSALRQKLSKEAGFEWLKASKAQAIADEY